MTVFVDDISNKSRPMSIIFVQRVII